MENVAALKGIDVSTLTPIVRIALQLDTFEIQNWNVRQLGGGVGNPVSVGLYRFEGDGQAQGEQRSWSVVLKIIQSPANVGQAELGGGEDQAHWNYWKREPMLYQSGLLDSLPARMVAPRCYGVVEQPGNIIWLWLEDIVDVEEGKWSLERYALAARHFGQMNGHFAMQSVWMRSPWLSRGRFDEWFKIISWGSILWEHPLVRNRYRDPQQNTFQRMLLDRERFLSKLDLLPKTICHGDTYPSNFMSRRLPNGQQQTVVLDWALTSVTALGEDLGQIIYGAQNNLKDTDPKDVDRVLFESYLDGLRDSGYSFDPQRVRFALAVSSALQVGLFQLFLFSEQLKQSDLVVEPYQEDANKPDCYEVVMANEAYRLLDVI